MERVSVLVIEDDEDVRSLLMTHLTALGCMVRTASDAEEGLRMAMTESPDLVVLDIAFPLVHGRRAFDLLQADARTSSCRIVVTSILDPEELAGVGADAVLPKPFLRSDVSRVLDEVTGTVKEGS